MKINNKPAMLSEMPVTAETFESIQNVDILKLSTLPEHCLRPILPCLVRMSLCSPLDVSDNWAEQRKEILKCLSGIETVNSLVGLLSIDFHALEQDARKEQQLRVKLGNDQTESVFISQLSHGVALEFEGSDAARKLRILLSELLFIMHQMKVPRSDFYWKSSELFESKVYAEEVSDVLCIAQAELPGLLPITEVTEALIHVRNGPWLLCRLVANVPDSFHEVCRSLVMGAEAHDEDGVQCSSRESALKMLCVMCPASTLTVRALCVKHCKLPSLAIGLTLYQYDKRKQTELATGAISDVIAFTSSLLLGNDTNVRNWLSHFIKSGQKRKDGKCMLTALRQNLLEQLKTLLSDEDGQLKEAHVGQACAFIRLYCALKGISAMRFNDEESRLLLSLLTSHPPVSAAGQRFISLALCMLLACPYILSSPEQEKTAIHWIKWLMKEVGRYEKASHASSSFGELLLLIAIRFHANQHSAIADLVSSTLGMKSAVKANALTRMKMIFVQEIFTEQVVARHAVCVAVTPNLSANILGYLPVHCIYQLLRTRTFAKHKVPIKRWIFEQMCACRTPIHSLMPQLIEVYINSVIPTGPHSQHRNEPITEQEIAVHFTASSQPTDDNDERDLRLTSRLLLLYYVLLYEDTRQGNKNNTTNGAAATAAASSTQPVAPYSYQLLSQLPIRFLLQQAQKQQHLYAGIFAPLLRLLATHYPHLCLVDEWLDEELTSISALCPVSLTTTPCSVPQLNDALYCLSNEGHSEQLLLLLDQLRGRSACDVQPFAASIVNSLPQLLARRNGLPRKLLLLVRALWLKLNTVMPRKLRVMTVNALQMPNNVAMTSYTEHDLTVNPLIVLRCDEQVFRCAPVLEIVLRILHAFLQASRSHLASHVQSKPQPASDTSAEPRNLDELKNALIAAQESAAVQMLLEICLPKTPEEKSGSLLTDLREVQGLVCSHVHQMYIADPYLVKLVHFQCYPSRLLELTVAGIPSMHICLDFIAELISQSDLDKQIFAVELVSHLSLQYALPKSLSAAKLSINVVTTLLTVLSSDTRVEFLLAVLPSLVRIGRALPPLRADISVLLLQMGQMCSAFLASAASLTASTDLVGVNVTLPFPKTLRQNGFSDDLTLSNLSKYTQLRNAIQETFVQLLNSTTLLKIQQT